MVEGNSAKEIRPLLVLLLLRGSRFSLERSLLKEIKCAASRAGLACNVVRVIVHVHERQLRIASFQRGTKDATSKRAGAAAVAARCSATSKEWAALAMSAPQERGGSAVEPLQREMSLEPIWRCQWRDDYLQ